MSKHVAVVAADASIAAVLMPALTGAGYRASHLMPNTDLAATLRANAVDIAFNAADRSGRLAGLLELVGMSYTHSGVLASALAANRHQAKIVLRSAGVPVTDHLIVDRAETARQHQLPPPYIVKPIIAGTGIAALAVLSDREGPPSWLLDADWRGGEEVLIERYAPGKTLDVVVMGGVALAVSETISPSAKEVEEPSQNQLVTPAQISPNIYEKLQKMALRAHEVLSCRGVTLVRFRHDSRASGDSGVVCLGVDALPSLMPGAPVPEQARLVGHSFADLVAWMVEDAGCNR